VGWIIGGSPSLMLKAAGEASSAPLQAKEGFLTRLAGLSCDPECADQVPEAWEHFSRAFQSSCAPRQCSTMGRSPAVRRICSTWRKKRRLPPLTTGG